MMDETKALSTRAEWSRRFTHWRSSQAFVVITVSTALFTDAFVYGVVVPFLPSLLQERHRISNNHVQMVTSLIVTAFGILDFLGAPLCAVYIDRTSNRRIPFLGGIVIMACGTMLFGGTHPWMLFLGRIIQGFASALLYTVSLALLVDTVPREEVGKWLGLALSCNNVGMVLSPLFGGVIYHLAGKYAVFGTTMGLIMVDAMFRILMIVSPRSSRENQIGHPKRIEGSTADGIDVTEIQITSDPESSSLSSQDQANDVTPILETPITRVTGVLRLIRSPRLIASLYGIFLNECLNASLMAVIPLFVKRTFSWSTLGAGLIFLTIAIPSIGGFVAGWLSDRFGPKRVAASGLLFTGPTIILLRFVQHSSIQQIALLCVLLTITGIAMNLFLSSLSADLSFVADEESRLQKAEAGISDDGITDMSLYAASFSLMNSAMAAATLLAPLFMGWLNQNHGWETMTAVLGSFVLSGVIPCMWFTGGRQVKDACGS